ncbi:STAS domain-containing protein [Micromonospora purpureochromogenes]|uniref:STAS domain-containing protein n=1 Tax=Micromonospora purpureochromogenes TaxID=47872 RepID=UPI0033F49B30
MHTEPGQLLSTSAADLRITLTNIGGRLLRVSVAGEVDFATSGELRAALDAVLADLTGTPVEVDLAEVPFLDSSGVHVLLDAYAWAADRDCPLVVANARPVVRRVLEITGVLALLGLAPAGR